MLLTRAPRGTADVLPKEAGWWHYIRGKAEEVTSLYGFEEIITPIFEHTELFVRTTGETSDIVTREMYTFRDKSDRSLTLRPEGTPGVGRAYLEHQLDSGPQPTKLYYFGPMFRYERPQAGRMRQFNQFGVELFGAESYLADAEVMMLGVEFLARLGLSGLEVQLNTIGCAVCRPRYREALVSYFRGKQGLCEDCVRRLETNPLRVLDCKNPECRTIAEGAPRTEEHLCDACRAHFDGLTSLLSQQGVPYRVNPRLVRGLDYYTRTVFEFVSPHLGAQNAVFGGGRYDGLIESLGGKPTPGVGWALGVERLIMTLQKEGLTPDVPRVKSVYVITTEATVARGFDLALAFRRAGVRAEIDLLGRSFKAQMKHADRLGADYAVFLGPDEVSKNVATVRTMKTGEQVEVDLGEVVSWVASWK